MRKIISILMVLAFFGALTLVHTQITMLQIPITLLSAQGGGCGLLPSSVASLISSSAPWYCPINQQIYSEWAHYLPLGIIAISISISIAAVIFAFGVVFKNQTIRNFGVAELYEAFATAIIVLAFLYVCAIMFGFVPSLFTGQLNPYATSIFLIKSTINQAESLYAALFNTYLKGSMLYSISLGFGSTGTFAAGGNLLNAILQVPINLYGIFVLAPTLEISKLLADGIIALYAEYYLIIFFATASIPVFIIPGTLFRAFIPTRPLGGMLIALGMAFYLVMPIMFSVGYYFTAPSINQQFTNAASQINLFSQNNGFFTNGFGQNSNLATSVRGISSGIASFWFLVFFYPGLIIAVVYVFVVQVSSFIGGASNMSGRLRSFI